MQRELCCSYIGSLAASMLGYIMPACIYFKSYETELRKALKKFDKNSDEYEALFQTKYESLKNFIFPFLMLCFGLIAMVTGVGSVFYDIGTH